MADIICTNTLITEEFVPASIVWNDGDVAGAQKFIIKPTRKDLGLVLMLTAASRATYSFLGDSVLGMPAGLNDETVNVVPADGMVVLKVDTAFIMAHDGTITLEASAGTGFSVAVVENAIAVSV